MYQNNWLLFFLQIIIILTIIHQTVITSVESAWSCSNSTMFNNGSTYQTNLNTVFRDLASNATNNPQGFYRTTVGNPSIEAIYGEYLCYGGENISSCHQCVVTATTTDIPSNCRNTKVGIFWEDQCQVRYSNTSFFNSIDEFPSITVWNYANIIGDKSRYFEAVTNMISNVLAVRAAEGGSFQKFATDFVNYSAIQPIYGLAQCTPNLNANDCYQCLNSSIERFDKQRPGGRVLVPSCVVRYETYPFFNLSYLPQVVPQSPSPLPSPSLASDSKPIHVSSNANVLYTGLMEWLLLAVVMSMALGVRETVVS